MSDPVEFFIARLSGGRSESLPYDFPGEDYDHGSAEHPNFLL